MAGPENIGKNSERSPQAASRRLMYAKRQAHSAHHFLKMVTFRFQDLEIWKLAIQIADDLFDVADELEKKRLYRFAEQLRGAGM
jgi:hypothetical protein